MTSDIKSIPIRTAAETSARSRRLIRLVQIFQRRRFPESYPATSPPTSALPPGRRGYATGRCLSFVLREGAPPSTRRPHVILIKLIGVEAAHARGVSVNAPTQ